MKKSTRKTIGILLIVAASIIFPLFNSDKYLLHLVSYSMIWVIMTQGLNVIQGLTGYISIAQATFWNRRLCERVAINSFGALVLDQCSVGHIGNGCYKFFIGVPSLKTKGHYFSIMTMAFGVVVWALMATLKDLTGGTSGLPNIPVPTSILGLKFF